MSIGWLRINRVHSLCRHSVIYLDLLFINCLGQLVKLFFYLDRIAGTIIYLVLNRFGHEDGKVWAIVQACRDRVNDPWLSCTVLYRLLTAK